MKVDFESAIRFLQKEEIDAAKKCVVDYFETLIQDEDDKQYYVGLIENKLLRLQIDSLAMNQFFEQTLEKVLQETKKTNEVRGKQCQTNGKPNRTF